MFFKKKYDLIVSIGEACPCSQALRKRKLQDFSYPFDWLFGGSLQDRVGLILSDFEQFLTLEDLQKVGSRVDPEPCDIYQNTSNHLVFNHDFPLDVPLSESFELVNTKYVRRCNRLIENIHSSKRILLVYIEIPNTPNSPVTSEMLLEEHRLLAEKFSNTEIDLLYVAHRSDFPKKRIVKAKLNDFVTKIELYFQNDTAETIHEVNLPLLVRLVKGYSLRRKNKK